MRSAKIDPSLGQINAQLMESERQIILQGNRQRREKMRREQFENPLSAKEISLRVNYPGRIMIVQRTGGVYDGKKYITVTRRGFVDSGPKSIYSKRLVNYVYDREGKFLHRTGLLKASIRRKLLAKRNRGKKVALGENLTGIFDEKQKHFRILETVRGKNFPEVTEYSYNIEGIQNHSE